MSFTAASDATPAGSTASPSDYLALLKPRVMSLVVFTALAGQLIAPRPMHPVLAFASLLAIAVGAGASGALNMWYEADTDALMTRTRNRPIPSGRVTRDEALVFGLVLAGLSVLTLGIVSNWFAAGCLAFTIFFYVVVYTIWLKRTTPQNIVIGGAAGAFPPMVGYAAATGSLSASCIALFAIIFIWTPPHFWALALLKSDDYAKAGIPMMPNVKGPDHTRLEILLYTLVLAPLGTAPWLMGFASATYGFMAIIGGTLMLAVSWRVFKIRVGAGADQAAKHLFAFSILYLTLLFAEIVAEHGLGLVLRLGA